MNNEKILREFINQVWNEKNLEVIPGYLSEEYKIYFDNADPWEGKVLDHAEFKNRLAYSFSSFPDIHFKILSAIEDGNLVAIQWIMTGTNTGHIGQLPPTNRKIEADGITFYHFLNGKICGHSQVYDRTKIMKQLGFIN